MSPVPVALQMHHASTMLRTIACLLLVASAAGCSSAPSNAVPDSSDAATTGSGADGNGTPPLGGGGLPDCSGACCAAPQAGAGCNAADQDASCPTSVRCPGGLGLPFSLVCDGTQWVAQGGDCGDSGIADNGCPSSQPQDGTPCTLPDGTSCQYSLLCSGTCDAGSISPGDSEAQGAGDASSGSAAAGTGCATVSGKVGPAICRGGQWATQSLGTCP